MRNDRHCQPLKVRKCQQPDASLLRTRMHTVAECLRNVLSLGLFLSITCSQ
jgi:hypothetical protein